jgi:galactokinase
MIDAFRELYGDPGHVRVFRAPGRVNLIGEHTDYNLGFVMPMALDLATCIGTAPASGGRLRIYSEQHKELREWPVTHLADAARSGHWTDYPLGVARELIRAGYAIEPANMLIRSTVPEGSGLSSSAALEVASALALLQGRGIDKLELARLCQRSEVEFVGLPCGIMDQYISVFGRDYAAVRIDCRSLEHRAVALPDGIAFVAVNTMVKHALAGSAYRQRTEECTAAVEWIQSRIAGVESLRDVSPAEFAGIDHEMPPLIARRARHVVMENERVDRFVEATSRSDLPLMGELLVESHRSLQHDYEVSCPELDFLVDAALAIDGVLGSRMTGGGFGGCTVTVLRNGAAGRFATQIAQCYEARFGVTPKIYPCRPSAGAGELNNFENIPPAV